MPKLSVEGVGEFEVPAGKRLVLALTDEAKVDQLHSCGGNARCTTCRVEFVAGEPAQMTVAEKNVLAAKGVSGVRLSCQILCDHDMTVKVISRLAGDEFDPARRAAGVAAAGVQLIDLGLVGQREDEPLARWHLELPDPLDAQLRHGILL